MNRKPLFDVVRQLLGRGFRKSEIAALDRACDVAGLPPAPAAAAPGAMRASPAAIDLIKRFEGCARLCTDGLIAAYPDPGTGGAPWTIGWGATGSGIGPETRWTQAQCDARLVEDVERCAAQVNAALAGCATSQGQFDALVSFHYNTGAIGRATLTKLHRAGRYGAAAGEFARWKHAGERVLKGLVRRRAEEARMYRAGS